MAQLDPNQEIQRLAALYAGMEDSQLTAMAEEAYSLTDESRQALGNELLRRGLDIRPNTQEPPPDRAELRRLATVGQFLNMSDALLTKGVLESAGIDSFLKNENTARLSWSNLVGGIMVQVAEEDLEQAQAILAERAPETGWEESE
jgi:hypothetical protein